MTENEAIKELKDYVAENDKLVISIEAVTLARKVLEEIQAYRAIGTVEDIQEVMKSGAYYMEIAHRFQSIGTIDEFKALKERSVAKRPIERERKYLTVFDCPTCNAELYTGQRFCDECGQSILDDYE